QPSSSVKANCHSQIQISSDYRRGTGNRNAAFPRGPFPPVRRSLSEGGWRSVTCPAVPSSVLSTVLPTVLGEASTTEIARNRDAQGFPQNKQTAREGGAVAGNARRELERKSGRKVVTSENYLSLAQSVKKVQSLPNEAATKP